MTVGLHREAFDGAEQVEEYASALRTGFLPLKFAYVGPAARTHDELVRSREYGLADIEARLLRARLPALSNALSLNRVLALVDVGSGNGMKAGLVLQVLRRRYQIPAYVALDYSAELLNIALANIAAALPDQHVICHRVDFEARDFRALTQPIRDEAHCPILFLLLGHTLGNPLDRQAVLSNVAVGMADDDHLLIGVELFRPDRVADVLAHYQNEPFYRAVFNPLSFSGLTRTDGTLEIAFNKATRDVEVHFRLLKDVTVDLGNSSRLHLTRGEGLLIFLSHRFTSSELADLCGEAGLQVEQMVSDRENSYKLALVSPVAHAERHSAHAGRSKR